MTRKAMIAAICRMLENADSLTIQAIMDVVERLTRKAS